MMLVNAQENVDVKKETVTKKTVVKGVDTKVMVTNNVDEEKEILRVDGDDKTNQNTNRVVEKNAKNEVMEDNSSTDVKNAQMMQEAMKKQEMDLEASRKSLYDQAMKENEAFEAKKMQMKADMEARRMELEKRPKGMNKLKKDN